MGVDDLNEARLHHYDVMKEAGLECTTSSSSGSALYSGAGALTGQAFAKSLSQGVAAVVLWREGKSEPCRLSIDAQLSTLIITSTADVGTGGLGDLAVKQPRNVRLDNIVEMAIGCDALGEVELVDLDDACVTLML